MIWSAKVIAGGLTDGSFAVPGQAYATVAYNNDTDKQSIQETYTTAAIITNWPNDTIANRLTQLNNVATIAVKLGAPGAATVVTPPTPPDPALVQFQSDYQLWKKYQLAIAQGLLLSSDKTFQTLDTNVKSEFKNDPLYLSTLY